MKASSYKEIMACPIVKLKFLDHAMGATEPCECEVYGRLIGEDERRYVIASWVTKDDDTEIVEANLETFVILKAVVTKVETLTPKRARSK